MFQHFHAGDNIVASGFLCGEVFGRNIAVVHAAAAFQQVQAGDTEGLFREVDAGNSCAAGGHGFRKQAAATTHIQYLFTGEGRVSVDPVKA